MRPAFVRVAVVALAGALLVAAGCRRDARPAPGPSEASPDAIAEDGASARDTSASIRDAGGGRDVETGGGEGTAARLAPTAFPWSAESDDRACEDGRDNDDNGFADCDDFACSRNAAVTVCGADAHYESSPVACANGADDDGDGRTDCADPDCAKNPFHSVCPALLHEQDCAGDRDTDGDGFAGCADFDCLIATGRGGCPDDGRTRVLFDLTLDETAAAGPHSDWVVDVTGRFPWPSNPTSADDWDGALSSFGFELLTSGDYLVENLPAWDGRLSFGDDENPQDLSRYDVLVLFEPSRPMLAAEKEAVLNFTLAGGGLLLVANHDDSDRDGNGYSARRVLDDLFDDNPIRTDPFGFRFDAVDLDPGQPMDTIAAPTHPVIDGPAGRVRRIGFYWGCTAHLTGSNAQAQALIRTADAPDGTASDGSGSPVGTDSIVAGVAVAGAGGRVVFLTDSAIGGDGSDSHGNRDPSKDLWNETAQDNRVFFLNALAWLAESGGPR